MKISDNTLAAFMAGVSTVQEDKLVLKEMGHSPSFTGLIDTLTDIDAIDGMDELRNEFNESIGEIIEFDIFNDLKTR